MRAIEWMLHQFRSLGPYLAIELIVPGGTIVALLLWTYRRTIAARQAVEHIANDQPACCTGA